MRRGAFWEDGSNAMLAGLFTLATFAGLPLAHYLGHGGVPAGEVFDIDLAEAPPSPPPPPRRRERKEIKKEVARLKLEQPRELIPLRAALRLDLAPGVVIGDFAIDFGVSDSRIEAGPEGDIFGVSDIDTPPRAISRVHPLYPAQARMRKIEGHVQLEFVVDIDGKVRGAEVTDSSPEGVFDAAALHAVKRWRFRSGTHGGRPIPVRVRQTVQFISER